MKLGLIKGRHGMPNVEGYIFQGDINPVDIKGTEKMASDLLAQLVGTDTVEVLDIYVTGLTMALISVLNVIPNNVKKVVLWHYNRDTNDYAPQEVRF